MNRNDVWQNSTGAKTDAVEAAPVRDLFDVVADIQTDAAAEPARYLSETEVPYGGE